MAEYKEPNMAVRVAAATSFFLAGALGPAIPARADTTWVALAIYAVADSTGAYWATNLPTQDKAEQAAMSNCILGESATKTYTSGCKPGGSTTTCMGVALGVSAEWAVGYGGTVQAAESAAQAKITDRANPPAQAHCSSDIL
jgi:hypothetical protein